VSVPAAVQQLQIQRKGAEALGADLYEPTLFAWWPVPAIGAGHDRGPFNERGFTLLVVKPEAHRG